MIGIFNVVRKLVRAFWLLSVVFSFGFSGYGQLFPLSSTLGFSHPFLFNGGSASIISDFNSNLIAPKSVSEPASIGNAIISGELKRFHKLTLTWNGPLKSEANETFTDFRLNVIFTSPSGKSYTVPGYFAADGNAEESSASEGNKWRCHFLPLETGNWSYVASFRTGPNIAISFDPLEGFSLPPIDGDSGNFNIGETDKTGKDFRSKGKLEYVGEHFMQWSNGEYFLKIGSNSPENFLEYQEFDDSKAVRSYTDHLNDWNEGDPTWKGGNGKGIIGAINYLGNIGVNSQYIVLHGGNNLGSPWTDPSTRYYSYDVSKTGQWQIVLDHMVKHGLMVHFVFSESTNQSFFEAQLPSGDPLFSDARKLFYREMVARFGYLNAITWNVGEESGWDRQNISWSGINGRAITTQQRLAFSAYIDSLTHYKDLITVHNGPSNTTAIFSTLLGENSFNGTSLQGKFDDTERSRGSIKQFRQESANANKKWVVYYDEAYRDGDLDANTFRKNVLWPSLTSGGAGMEHYATNGLDGTLKDFRIYDVFFRQMKHAYDLYHNNDIPFHLMYNQDELVANGWCHGDEYQNYVVYVPVGNVGKTTMDLLNEYSIKWYDPRNGGELLDGSITNLSAGNDLNLGIPPHDPNFDWVIVLQNKKAKETSVSGVLIYPEEVQLGLGDFINMQAQVIPGTALDKRLVWSSSNASVATVDANGVLVAIGLGFARITAKSVDGNFEATANVNVVDTSQFCTGLGQITMERYDNIPGNSLDFLVNAATFPDNASFTAQIDSLEIESNIGDNYGVRVSGYLCPPQTGHYIFWIAGDNYVRLKLSTDDKEENAEVIAYHEFYTEIREWNKLPTQRSNNIWLEQGKSYYIEALMKEGEYGEHMAVGWRKPYDGNGSTPTEIIPGSVLSPRFSQPAVTSVTGVRLDADSFEVRVGETIKMNAQIEPFDATDTRIAWSVDNVSVASVDSTGDVKGVSLGIVIVTVTTLDGNFKAQAAINVVEKEPKNEDAVIVDEAVANVQLGTIRNLNTLLVHTEEAGAGVIWSVEDESVVTIDGNGNVYGVSVGNTRVKATSANGTYVTSIDIMVYPNEIRIYPNPSYDYITIEGPPEEIKLAAIFNTAGQLVKFTLEGNRIYVGNLGAGVYVLVFPNGRQERFIKN